MKKFLGVILTLAMLFCSLSMLTISATVTPDQNAAPGTEAYTAYLKSEGYTEIATYAELAAISDMTGKYYISADITMANTATLHSATPFSGVLDGNGHTVYNGKFAIFGKMSGTMKNVTFSKYTDSTKQETFDTTAAIVATELQNGAVMDNVINEKVYGEIISYWGSFSRQISSNATVRFVNCVNNSSLESPFVVNNHKLGGFIGQVNAGADVTFENCVNNAEIKASQAGGFVGVTKGKSLSFINCTNNGRIVGLIGKTSGEGSYGISGGFVGGYNNAGALESSATISFQDCVNNGNVVRGEMGDPSTKTTKVTSGGLIGNFGSSTSSKFMTLVVKDCLIQNCMIGGETAWQDVTNAETGELITDYTQGCAGAIIGWFGNNQTQDSITIENVLVYNVTVKAGDPSTASAFFNASSDTNNVAMKNTYAIASTYNELATGKYSIENTGTDTNVTVNKAQASAPSENTMSLRFLGSIDSLDYLEIGYLIEITVDGNTTYEMISTKTAYETVNNGNGTLSKSDFGGKYILAMAIDNQASNVTATYSVTPFALDADGVLTTGVTRSITLTNGALS